MTLQVRPFPAELAGVVSGWARTESEVLRWCGANIVPVPPEQISGWAQEDWVEPFGLFLDDRLVGYGELWVDDEEAEVELARLIIDPSERGQRLGGYLANELASLARTRHRQVMLRVHPENTPALRCYATAGFNPVAPAQAATWNTGQPHPYIWLIPAAA